MTQVTPNSVQQHIDLHLETGNTAARPKRTTVEELLLQTVEPASSMHIDNALEKHVQLNVSEGRKEAHRTCAEATKAEEDNDPDGEAS